MAFSSLSLNCVSTTLSKEFNVAYSNEWTRPTGRVSCHNSVTCPRQTTSYEENHCCKRRLLLLGAGVLTARFLPASPLLAEGIPKNYDAFVDKIDGYSYYYPLDWIDFDYIGHDSAFKDRFLQLQTVRVRFLPTAKKDVHDLGPIEEVVSNLTKHVYAAPNQVATILDMQERTIDGKNYYFFEYGLRSPNFATTSFASIAIANGRYYTMIVGANERRWKRVRNKLKVIADSFKVLDI